MDCNLFLGLIQQSVLIQGVKVFAAVKIIPAYFAVKFFHFMKLYKIIYP
jgi:hypothetical protein